MRQNGPVRQNSRVCVTVYQTLRTALSMAVIAGHADLVELLLE